MDTPLDDLPPGPLVTEHMRALIGRDSEPFDTEIETERLPLILAELGETGLDLRAELPPWLVVGVGLTVGLHEFAPQLLPETALTQVAWEFFAPIRLDVPLKAVARIDDIRDRIGGRYGHTVMATVTAELRDPDGRKLATTHVSRVQFQAPGELLANHAPSLSDATVMDTVVDAAAAGWPPEPRRFDTIHEGDELPPQQYLPTHRSIPAFLPRLPGGRVSQSNNLDSALRQGYEGLVVPISAQLCTMARQASQWAGDPYSLRLIRGAFREPDYVGRPITFLGNVAQRERSAGCGLVDLECGAFAGGRQSVRATIRVALPL